MNLVTIRGPDRGRYTRAKRSAMENEGMGTIRTMKAAYQSGKDDYTAVRDSMQGLTPAERFGHYCGQTWTSTAEYLKLMGHGLIPGGTKLTDRPVPTARGEPTGFRKGFEAGARIYRGRIDNLLYTDNAPRPGARVGDRLAYARFQMGRLLAWESGFEKRELFTTVPGYGTRRPKNGQAKESNDRKSARDCPDPFAPTPRNQDPRKLANAQDRNDGQRATQRTSGTSAER